MADFRFPSLDRVSVGAMPSSTECVRVLEGLRPLARVSAKFDGDFRDKVASPFDADFLQAMSEGPTSNCFGRL